MFCAIAIKSGSNRRSKRSQNKPAGAPQPPPTPPPQIAPRARARAPPPPPGPVRAKTHNGAQLPRARPPRPANSAQPAANAAPDPPRGPPAARAHAAHGWQACAARPPRARSGGSCGLSFLLGTAIRTTGRLYTTRHRRRALSEFRALPTVRILSSGQHCTKKRRENGTERRF